MAKLGYSTDNKEDLVARAVLKSAGDENEDGYLSPDELARLYGS